MEALGSQVDAQRGSWGEDVNKGSEHEKLTEAFDSVGLRCREIAIGDEEFGLFARAHGVPEGVEARRALELANGDILFFDEGGRYVGLGSSYDDLPLFWPRGKDEPTRGGR